MFFLKSENQLRYLPKTHFGHKISQKCVFCGYLVWDSHYKKMVFNEPQLIFQEQHMVKKSTLSLY